MDKKKFKTFSTSVLIFFIVVLSVMSITIFYFDMYYGLASVVLSIIFMLIYIRVHLKISQKIKQEYDSIGNVLSEGAKYININLPIAMMIVSESGEVVWYNAEMKEAIIGDATGSKKIEDLVPDLDFTNMVSYYKNQDESDDDEVKYAENTNRYEIRVDNKYFDIKSCRYKQTKGDDTYYYAVYFYELSIYKEVEKKYQTERPVVAYIEVDNYDDIMNEIQESERPFMSSELEKIIQRWASRMNALIKKYEKDKYILIVSHSYFENLEIKRFAILDEVRAIDVVSNTHPTISIGVCADEYSFSQQAKEAFRALEIGLGRGGDQAVVRKHGEYEFYGGKSEAVEKRNRVKARIIAHAFKPIIDESEVVYIMGHQYPDMDAFGAAIGVYKAAVDRGKQAKIVLEEANETIIGVYRTFENDENYVFIRPEYAIDEMDFEKDLLVVVDTHRPSFTECPELVEKATRKVLIDHHRRGVEFIEDALLTYLEPYASSACELVTEVLQYMEKNMTLTKKEAEALLAGIVVDTKNFSSKTGVRTFESASVLKKFNADTTVVKQFMQDDLDSFVNRSNIISNSRIIHETMAISVTDVEVNHARLIAAQAADEMLNIRGISTSFVIVKSGEDIFISARALKETNVQLIMEKLGGGGHRGASGAQFRNSDIHEVEQLLLEEIDRYVREE